jgi:hypothetical protein
VTAGFEINVKDCASSSIAGLFEGEDFRVFHALVGMEPFADHLAFGVNQHCADIRVRRREAEALACQLERPAHKDLIGRACDSQREDLFYGSRSERIREG